MTDSPPNPAAVRLHENPLGQPAHQGMLTSAPCPRPLVTAEELQRIHDEIGPVLERYTERSSDPSSRPYGARAGRGFAWTAVSPRQ